MIVIIRIVMNNEIRRIYETSLEVKWWWISDSLYIDALMQDCSNSTANALELLQSCTKPSIWGWTKMMVISDSLYIDGLMQDCSNSTANTLELLQFCTKPSIWGWTKKD